LLSHCANPQCSRPFLHLRQGKLFLVETKDPTHPGTLKVPDSAHLRLRPRRVERYWMCDECAAVWTLVHDRNRGIVLLPLRRAVARAGETAGEYRGSA
jgi:hypothetical protein